MTYYQRGSITLHLGECQDIDLSPVHGLLVADPPYGMEFESNNRHALDAHGPLHNDGSNEWVKDALADVLTVGMIQRRHVYVFGPSESIPDSVVRQTEIIWDKGSVGIGDLHIPWGPQHESITFGVYAPFKSQQKNGGGLAAKMRRGSIVRAQRINGLATSHPTQKPVSLLTALIESSSIRGDIVLDPFIGSGSTAVAAILTGRGCTGIDSDEKWLEVAAKRCDEAFAAGDMVEWIMAERPARKQPKGFR